MEYCNDFRYDLKFGQLGEVLLSEILTYKNVEVKRDNWISKSGNLAIEYESRGKPSGIAITEADYWCFIFSGELKDQILLMIKVELLKNIARNYYIKGNIKQMGDNNTSKSVLIPFKDLIIASLEFSI